MISGIFNSLVTIKRRASTGRDALNNPTYGDPTSGAGWSTVYTNMTVRLAFSANALVFAQTGERPNPAGIMYFPPSYALQLEDRVLTADGIEYVVTSIVTGYINNVVVDHYEAILALP